MGLLVKDHHGMHGMKPIRLVPEVFPNQPWVIRT